MIIGDSAVKKAAVVPYHQIALAPSVGINELPSRRVLQKLIKQRRSFRLGHTENVRGVIAEIKRLPASLRMSTHEGVVYAPLLARIGSQGRVL